MWKKFIKERVILYLLVILVGISLTEAFIFFETLSNPRTSHFADFRHFFIAAQMMATGAANRLYNNIDAQIIFHPPFQIIAYIPLIIMPLKWAYRTWIIINLGIIFISLKTFGSFFRPTSKKEQLIMWLACLSFFPTMATLLQGQDSAVSLLIFTLVFFYIKSGKEGKAGAMLALGLFKPQLVGLTAIVLLFKGRWKALSCFCLVALVLISLSLLMVGWQGGIDYLKLIMKLTTSENQYGIFPAKMYNLKGFFYLIFGSYQNGFLIPFLGITTIGFIILLFLIWKKKWEPSGYLFDLKFSLLIIITSLISPHLFIHDLILLIIPGILMVNYLNQEHSKIKGYILKVLLPFGYMGVLFPSLNFASLHLQTEVLLMMVGAILLAYEISLIKRSEEVTSYKEAH